MAPWNGPHEMCSSVSVMSLITFYIQNVLNKLTHYPPAAWESPSHLSNGILQQGSLHLLQCAHQLWNCFGYSMVFVWLLQAAKICGLI